MIVSDVLCSCGLHMLHGSWLFCPRCDRSECPRCHLRLLNEHAVMCPNKKCRADVRLPAVLRQNP